MRQLLGLLLILCASISFGQGPTANFSASPLEVCVGTPINFTDASTAGSVPITSRTWDFGDGASSNDLNPTHTYTAAGTYTVTLVVTDQNGIADPEVKPAYIIVNPLPQTDFTFTGNGCTVPFDVTFTNASAAGPNITYAWDFGNGQTSTATNPPAVTYSTAGTFPISLTVTNTTTGCVNTLVQDIVVSNFAAGINAPTDACIGEPVIITDQSTVGANQWNWDFGNGQTSTSQNTSTVYTTAGTYTISLLSQNTNSGCQDVATHTITVNPLPTPGFVANPTIGCAPFSVNFTNTSPAGGSSYLWNYGDGSTATGFSPGPHVYTANGSYSVTLSMIDANGCPGTTTQIDVITVTAPIVDFTLDENDGCAPVTVQFTDLSTSPNPTTDPIVSWTWDFGDGSPPYNGQTPPPHVYTTIGSYTVTLTATTQAGCIGTEIKLDTIEVGGHSIPDFTVSPLTNCAKSDFQFTNLTTFIGTPDPGDIEYFWNYGDGGTGTGENPIYEYPVDTGYFSPQLIVDWNGCQDTIVYDSLVYIDAPIAGFLTSETVVCNPGSFPVTIDFTDLAISGEDSDTVEMVWDWGDGTFTTLNDSQVQDFNNGDESHDFSGYGTFPIEQFIYNYTTGCEDSITNFITITQTVADFQMTSDSTCLGVPVIFSNTSTSTDLILDSLLWNMDNTITFENDPTVTYAHSTSGQYEIGLYATNIYGCTDSTTQTLEVLSLPDAIITPSAVAGCAPITVTYTNSSTPTGNGVPLESHFWTFPNLSTQLLTSQSPTQYTYTTEGTFTTTLVVTDEYGCISSPDFVTMTLTKPTADFILDSVVCDEEDFIAQNTSVDAQSYQWFVDGSSQAFTSNFPYSFDEVTSSAYNNVPHTVTLISTDQNGCTDTATQNIVVSLPYIDLSYTVTGASINSNGDFTCPPVFASFSDSSNTYGSVASWNWDFGDGKFSTFENPNNTYVYPGTYTASFSIVDEFGCTADTTLVDYLTIFGPTGQAMWTSVGDICQQTFLFEADSLLNVTDIMWTLGDGNVINSLTPFPYEYGSYQTFDPTATLLDGQGCEVILELPQIYVINNGLNALFTSDPLEGPMGTTFTFTDESSFTTAPINSWTWYLPNDTITNFTDAGIVNEFGPPGTYSVTLVVADTNGCFHDYTFDVVVTNEFHLPNVFTPNGDGVNEVFEMQNDVFESFEIVIMNRWGNVVHRRTDATGTYLWDGLTQSGERVADGVYFYRLTGTLTDGSLGEKHGSVTVIENQ
jgi:gliding motility-associated-like protein